MNKFSLDILWGTNTATKATFHFLNNSSNPIYNKQSYYDETLAKDHFPLSLPTPHA